jgi:Anti-sigma factor NepR
MSKAKPTDESAPADDGVDPKAAEAIGRALKAHYDDLVQAPLPDRFRELIASLDAADEATPKGGTNAPG